MKFEATPLTEAHGAILGHNVYDHEGRRVLRKGRALGDEELDVLAGLGRDRIFAARLEPGDVDENEAARRVSEAVAGTGLDLRGPTTGRVNLHAQTLGLLRVDAAALDRINDCHGVTLATLPNHSVARAGKMVATTKILPYALPEATVAAAESVAANRRGCADDVAAAERVAANRHGCADDVAAAERVAANRRGCADDAAALAKPPIRLDALPASTAGLIVSGTVAVGRSAGRERLVAGFEKAFRQRLAALGGELGQVRFVPIDREQETRQLAEAAAELAPHVDLLILAGETAIQDRHDLGPSAIEAAGGSVVCYGAPVDPGNLLLLAELGDTPVLGAPGCARSPKRNIVDLVLPRLLAGDRLTRRDITSLGHGGLLEDLPERPLPRRRIEGA